MRKAILSRSRFWGPAFSFHLSIGVAAALLAGCGGSQLPTGVAGTTQQSPTIATHANRDGSWMLPGAKSGKLLYVSAPVDQKVYVYSLPAGQLVGTLTGLVNPAGECSDKAGHVWIALNVGGLGPGTVVEYARGGTKPIAKLDDSDPPQHCSVDPTTGNLAVAPAYGGHRGIAIYANARGLPKYHRAKNADPWDCVYDNSGNLFVAAAIGPYASKLYWLRKGAATVTKYFLYPPEYADDGIGWDGQHLVISPDGYDLYQYTQHNQVGETVLKGGGFDTTASLWIQGSTLIAVNGYAVAFYAYPSGGYPFKVMNNAYSADGLTVSI
ncbi:MAG TPA: hypothetical protein VIW73_03595 [Candidatus Cybelea sp.]